MKNFNLLYIGAAMLGMGIANAIFKKKRDEQEAIAQKAVDEFTINFMNDFHSDMAQKARESFSEVLREES